MKWLTQIPIIVNHIDVSRPVQVCNAIGFGKYSLDFMWAKLVSQSIDIFGSQTACTVETAVMSESVCTPDEQ